MLRLRERIDLLPPSDRLLVELVMSGAVSRKRAAELLGVEPGTVTRRLRRISARLHDPIVRELMMDRCPLAADYRQIGVEHFLTGLSAEKLGHRHGIRASEVRRMLQFVRGWCRGRAGVSRR